MLQAGRQGLAPLGKAVPGDPLNTQAVGEEERLAVLPQATRRDGSPGCARASSLARVPVTPLPASLAGSEMIETQEDIYVGSIETDRGVREQVRFYDTRGLRDGLELPKHCFSCTDGYVLVYSTDSKESFKRVELLKKEIDKSKDKKEVSTPGERGCRVGSAPLLQVLTQRLSFPLACHKTATGVSVP